MSQDRENSSGIVERAPRHRAASLNGAPLDSNAPRPAPLDPAAGRRRAVAQPNWAALRFGGQWDAEGCN